MKGSENIKVYQNEYIEKEYFTILRIRSEKYGIFDYILDNDDVYKTKQYHWGVTRVHNKYNTSEFFYGMTSDKSLESTKRMLHRFINDTPKGLITDHIDGDTLNTRKENLRTCTYKDNGKNKIMPATNKSGHKGVYWDIHIKNPKWKAFIKKNDKMYHLGYYDNYEDAVEARKQAEIYFQGEFSRDYGDEKLTNVFFDENGKRRNKRKINQTIIACNHCSYWNKNKDQMCDILTKQTGYWNKCDSFDRKEGY